jgi:hypothetical protein
VSEQPGRYQRSTSGMVGALLVTLLVILAFVAFRACTRTNLDVRPDHVDYLTPVHDAQQAGADLVYPATLPSGWYATRVDYLPGGKPELGLSFLTDGNRYAGMRLSPAPVPVLLTQYVDAQPTAGSPVTLDTGVVRRWDTWTDAGGDTALVARWHGESLMVFGSASQADLETLAGSLTDAPARAQH